MGSRGPLVFLRMSRHDKRWHNICPATLRVQHWHSRMSHILPWTKQIHRESSKPSISPMNPKLLFPRQMPSCLFDDLRFLDVTRTDKPIDTHHKLSSCRIWNNLFSPTKPKARKSEMNLKIMIVHIKLSGKNIFPRICQNQTPFPYSITEMWKRKNWKFWVPFLRIASLFFDGINQQNCQAQTENFFSISLYLHLLRSLSFIHFLQYLLHVLCTIFSLFSLIFFYCTTG